MAHVTVPVLKPLTHQGRSYVRGDMVTMEAIEAAAHGRSGVVSLTRGAQAPTYKTRDMAAEAGTVEAPRTRRRYRRRDLTAEASPE